MKSAPVVLDVASTSQGAYRLLRLRAERINADGRFLNIVVCPPGEEVKEIEELGVEVIEWKVSRNLNPFSIPGEILQLMKIFEETEASIVHSHNSKAGGVSRIATALFNLRKRNSELKVVHQVHGFVFGQYEGLKRSLFLAIERFLALFTDYLLFQNTFELDLAERAGFSKRALLCKIGNGISFEEFERLIDELQTKDRDNICRIISVARLEPVKNQQMLIQSLGYLREHYGREDFFCSFIGEGDSQQYTDQITRLGLQGHVEFTGKLGREEIVKYYAKADINVLTSRTEGMPRALMEAIYMGVPSIGTDVIGTIEVIKPGISGEIVPLDDVKALADRINELWQNPERRAALSKSGREYAKQHFDENKVVDKLLDLYDEIVKS